MGGLMNGYVAVCILVMVLVALPLRAYSETNHIQGIEWIVTPGKIASTTNASAVFNWTYSAVDHPVNIAWYYKGTIAKPQLVYILGYSNDRVYIPNSDIESRLQYEEYPESATMILQGVTVTDVGIYEAKVAVLDEEHKNDVPSITDFATLTVISEADLKFRVTIDDLVFDICVAENGTDVNLPNKPWDIMSELGVSIEVQPSAPQPAAIEIQNGLGSYIYSYHTCVGSHFCERSLQFHQMQAKDNEADIVVIINFDIQNTEKVTITHSLIFNALPGTVVTAENPITFEPCAETQCTSCVVAGCVTSILLTAGMLAAVIYYKRNFKIVQIASEPEQEPMSSLSSSEAKEMASHTSI